MERKRRILIAPLDWGLGHATRCVPLIYALLQKNVDVLIAGSGSSAQLLQREFPDLKFFDLPGYHPQYPAQSSGKESTTQIDNAMVWTMGQQLPHFIKTIYREHTLLNALVKKQKIDVVISDNRYGCYSTHAKSVFMTHQAHILMPDSFKWMEGAVNYFNQHQMARFDACWIPAPNRQLLKDLVPEKLPGNTRFIGYLSRFEKVPTELKYDVVVVASGPEPQRGVLVDMLRAQLKQTSFDVFIVQGIVRGKQKMYTGNNFTEANYLDTEKLNQLLLQAKIVIARPGYSTVMDLARLGKKAIFIPTPGQTEQTYLAHQLMEQNIAFSMPQQGFNLATALKESNKFSGFANFEHDAVLLDQAIQSIL